MICLAVLFFNFAFDRVAAFRTSFVFILFQAVMKLHRLALINLAVFFDFTFASIQKGSGFVVQFLAFFLGILF